jgi:hypothetical protein
MIETNENLRIKINVDYPPYNNILFEEYFYKEFVYNNEITNRIYIPIFWTGLYVNRNYGQGDLSDIQSFLDNLDKSKKYFTIVQYDDNILNDLKDLDILIFAMGGHGKYKDKSYPIPLNCLPPQGLQIMDKDIFASFIGSINGRHIIREKMANALRNNNKYIISEHISYPQFREIMSRSIFSLCPRGYGQTSFRICEALQVQSIPVYIYDEPLIPFYTEFDFNDIGILIHENEIDKIDEILSSKTPEEIQKYIDNGIKIYNNFFEYKGCYNSIIKYLNK